MTNEKEADIKTKKTSKINHVWWLPLIALILVIFLGIQHITSQGPLINIRFNDASGLKVKKTKVFFKDMEIGVVEDIQLSDEFEYIDVSVRMDEDVEGLLRQKTEFWIVKPHVSITQISGLSTLLSGNHIAIDPDLNNKNPLKYSFTGLENAPVITSDKAGLYLTLLTSQASSLYPGTAVYYKGMRVGKINRVYFSDDYLWVKADVFISAPHDKLIKQSTKFWSANGFSVDVAAGGLTVEMESFETLIGGGIAFDTPVSFSSESPVYNGTEYILYKNKTMASNQDYGNKHYYITYFDGSVQGLTKDSPVLIQGIKVGKVKDVNLIYDSASGKIQIPVLFEIYENRLGINKKSSNSKNVIEKMIVDGLKAKIEAENLLTGTKHISLTFINKEKDNNSLSDLVIDEQSGYPVIPSTAGGLDAIATSIGNLVNKVNRLPLEDLTNHIDELVTGANQTLSHDLKKTIGELNGLLSEGKVLSKTARKTLKQLDSSVKKLAKSAENTLSGYSPDGPLYYNLNNTLNELNDTLRSIKNVSEIIDRTPNALIFGEEKNRGKK